jgi:hypothetical protein
MSSRLCAFDYPAVSAPTPEKSRTQAGWTSLPAKLQSLSVPIAIATEAVAALIGTAVALLAVAVAVVTAERARQLAAEIAARQHQQTIDLQGTGLCINYRTHVIELRDRGMSAEQIRELLLQEGGMPDPATDNKRLMIENRDGCAPIDEIIRLVPPRPMAHEP